MASFESHETTLKLLVDNKTRKVLFADAGKDFVDMMFALLRLPIGVMLVAQQHHVDTMHGSVGHLFKSVDDMDASYFLPNIDKDDKLHFPDLLPPTNESYMNGLANYMVTDGLEVMPMSAMSGITLINRFRVSNDVKLAEKIIAVGDDEVHSSIGLTAVALLEAVLCSDTVLSDVFLVRKK